MTADSGDTEGSGAQSEARKVDLPDDLRADIRNFARSLTDLDYYEILGVDRDVEPLELRNAFFQRSKKYHPDRYFNRELGAYAGLLHEIYKRVVVAHDVLRDLALRGSYDKTLGDATIWPQQDPELESLCDAAPGDADAGAADLADAEPVAAAPKPRPAHRRSGLRARASSRFDRSHLRSLERQLQSGRKTAGQHFAEAEKRRQAGDLARAVELVKLAIAFDPRESKYHDALAEILPQANADSVIGATRDGKRLLDRGDEAGALEFLREAARLVPTDHELNAQVAQLVFKTGGDLEEALEFAMRAVEIEEKCAAYRKLVGRIYKAAGRPAEARQQLQRAWELDPMDKEVRSELVDL